MRLQRGVVAYNSDVRERLAELGPRSMSSEASAGYLTSWMPHALAWFIPESDAGLVEVQSQNWPPMWDVFLQEMEPLPHGCCLGDRKHAQKRFRFLNPPFSLKTNTRPPNGGRSAAPKMRPGAGPVWLLFRDPETGLGSHGLRRQGAFGRQTAETQVPPFSKALQPFLGRSAPGRAPVTSMP